MRSASHATVLRCGCGVLVAVAAALAVAVPALAQDKPPAQSASSPGEYMLYEVSPFVGYQWFHGKYGITPSSELLHGPVLGFHVDEDFWKYIGLEQSFTAGMNDLRVHPPAPWSVDTEARNYTLAINPMFYFTPRQSKVRPFVTAGAGVTKYSPDRSSNPFLGASAGELTVRYSPAVILGAGIKINATSRIGLRFDVRGLFTESQHASGFLDLQGLAATGGIMFRFGRRTEEAAVAPPQAPPAATPTPTPTPVEIQIAGISGAHDVCPGESVRLDVSASGWLPNQTPSYQWMVDGQPVAGATDSSFSRADRHLRRQDRHGASQRRRRFEDVGSGDRAGEGLHRSDGAVPGRANNDTVRHEAAAQRDGDGLANAAAPPACVTPPARARSPATRSIRARLHSTPPTASSSKPRWST